MTFLQKVWSSSPCAVANRSLAFFMPVLEQWLLPCWAAFQVMSILDSFYCGYRYFCSIFTRCFAVVLGFICTFHIKVRSSLRVSFLNGMTAAWSHAVYTCVLLFVQMNVVPSDVWNWSQGWTRPVEVYNIFSEVLADFFWFSHDVKKRGTEFEGRPWNTSTGTPPIDKKYEN